MYMTFEWKAGKDVFRVLNYNLSFYSEAGETKLTNCQPGVLNLLIEIPRVADPAKDFFDFAITQHDKSAEKGSGKITVFEGEKVSKQSLQTVEFKKAWITALEINVSDTDDKFHLNCSLAAAEVVISGVGIVHLRRDEHYR